MGAHWEFMAFLFEPDASNSAAILRGAALNCGVVEDELMKCFVDCLLVEKAKEHMPLHYTYKLTYV